MDINTLNLLILIKQRKLKDNKRKPFNLSLKMKLMRITPPSPIEKTLIKGVGKRFVIRQWHLNVIHRTFHNICNVFCIIYLTKCLLFIKMLEIINFKVKTSPKYSFIPSIAFCFPMLMRSSNLSRSSSFTFSLRTSISSIRFFICFTILLAFISSCLTFVQSPKAKDFSIWDLWFFKSPKLYGTATSLNFFADNWTRFNGNFSPIFRHWFSFFNFLKFILNFTILQTTFNKKTFSIYFSHHF